MNITGKLKSFLIYIRRPAHHALRIRKGQTLVEVVMGTLIAAITTMSVFSVVLSASVSQGKGDKREAATFVLKQLQETLKSYVTVERCTGPGCFLTNHPGTDVNWHLNGDSKSGWALASGTHDLDTAIWLPPTLKGPGTPTPSLSYTVVNKDCGFGTTEQLSCKQVTLDLKYPD